MLRTRRFRMDGRRRFLVASAVFLSFFVLAGAAVYIRLLQGPIAIDSFTPRLAAALEEHFGKGWRFQLGEASLERGAHGATLAVGGLNIQANGRTVVAAPRAEVSLDPVDLLMLQVRPRRLDVFDLEVQLSVRPDGSIAISAGQDASQAVPIAPPLETAVAAPGAPAAMAPNPKQALLKQAAAALATLFDSIAGPDSPVGAIDRIAVARGRLVIDDQKEKRKTVFGGLELAFDKSEGTTTLNVSADGPNGRWAATVQANGTAATERTLDLDIHDVTLDEIVLAGGWRKIGFDTDMPMSLKLHLGLTPDGAVGAAHGRFVFNSGFFRLDDPDHEPVFVDEITGGFLWTPAEHRFLIEPVQFFAGETHFTVSGEVAPGTTPEEPWTIALGLTEPGGFAAERPGDKQLVIEKSVFDGRLALGDKKLFIDRFEASGPNVGFAASGQFAWANGPHLKLGASASPTPIRNLLRIWPTFMAANVRAWALANIVSGTVQTATIQVDYNAADLTAMRADKVPSDESTLIDFTIADGSVVFMDGVAPLNGVSGKGHFTGRTSNFVATSGWVESGGGRRLTMSEGSFQISDSGVKPTKAAINLRASGSVEAISELLNTEAIKSYANLPLDPTSLSGQIDGKIGVDLLLGGGASRADTVVRLNANVMNLSAEKLVGREKLDNASMTIAMDKSGLRAVGQGRLFGGAASLDFRKPANGPGEAAINVTLDDQARAKQGWSMSGVTGLVTARITSPLPADAGKAQVEFDLTKASLDGVFAGVVKPAGRPAKIAMSVTAGEKSTLLDQIFVDAGSMQARGSAELEPYNILLAAKFPQLRLSPGDDMHVDAQKGEDGLKLSVRGTSIDARPFIKYVTRAGDDKARGTGTTTDFDVDLKTALLTGNNKQAISNVELRLVRHGGLIRQFALTGKFGRENLTGSIGRTDGGVPRISIVTNDAGSLVGFLDFYKRMEGGSLNAQMLVGESHVDGNVEVRDFMLRDEPAVRRLVTEGAFRGTGKEATFDPTLVRFDRLQFIFARAGSHLDLRDGTMSGQQIGLTVDGWLDFANDKVSLNGTFVPAFTVNNFFSKIPVFGLFMGGSNEGLLGVTYGVSGALSSPTLNVNPLSPFAPGILRKIFMVGGGERSAGPPATQLQQPAFSPER
ncbi:MAG: hypothetical protein JOZ16_10265 [Methylobacteriaceae bacterium]|nr:hypothetical protein [Methylobacteriaceae bacterium]